MRGLYDITIITSRVSIQDFARYADRAGGLRVSMPLSGTEQKDNYPFGGMPLVLLVTLQLLQAIYSFIIGQLAVPQWVNPLLPSDPPEKFSAAFILKFGGQQSITAPAVVFTVLFVIIFPFVGVYIMHCMISLVEEIRDMSVSQLDSFVPQYLAEKFVPGKFRSKKRSQRETTSLVPAVPLQMPGPATNSLVLSIACHPSPEEVGTGMAYKKLKWGVVREPAKATHQSLQQDQLFSPASPTIGLLRSEEPAFTSGQSEREKRSSHTPIDPSIPPPPPPKPTPSTYPQLSKFSSDAITVSITPLSQINRTGSDLSTSTPDKSAFYPDRPRPAGHCSFSAMPVTDLQPDALYTGIRRDDIPFGPKGRASLLLAGVASSAMFVRKRWWMQTRIGRRVVGWGFPGYGGEKEGMGG